MASTTTLSLEIEGRRRQLDGLSKRYVDEVMSAGGVDLMSGSQGREHIADLHRQMAGDRVAISGLETKTDVLEARLREQETRLTDLPEQAIKLAQLQRDRQAAERTYADVAARLQELRIAEESELGYATIIREALVPAAPVRPNLRRNLALGLLAGTVLGVAGAAARRRRDRRLYSLDDARRATGSLIGAVPKMDWEIRSDFGRKETVEIDGREIGTGVVTLLNGMSPAAEAFRHIRTNIQFSRPETVVQTVVVTSACPGEGKTTTAANIAVVMAQAGRRTLLLDADLRRPKVHRLFGRSRRPPSRAFINPITRDRQNARRPRRRGAGGFVLLVGLSHLDLGTTRGKAAGGARNPRRSYFMVSINAIDRLCGLPGTRAKKRRGAKDLPFLDAPLRAKCHQTPRWITSYASLLKKAQTFMGRTESLCHS